MTDCLFCAIGAGDIPSADLYEDNETFAFLDINPLQAGHALVIPKAHVDKHEALDDKARAAVWATVARLTPLLVQEVGAEDATIAINDGPTAGQEVPHCHVHIVPRKKGDSAGPVHALFKNRPTPDNEALHDLAIRIQRKVAV